MQLVKGDELNVLSENGSWIKVAVKSKTGWVQKIFTSKTKPGNKVTLFGSESKRANIYARKRASSDVTAASARGLTADSARARGKNSKDNYFRPDLLSSMEKLFFSDNELIAFLEEGKILKK